ncbi:MAG: Pr6Pr family membrane protein [Pseudomonadota bacterium]
MPSASLIRIYAVFILAAIGAGLGAFLLIAQGFETVGRELRGGSGWVAAILYYLSFLTTLANAGLVAVYAWFISGGRRLRAMQNPTIHAFLAALVLIVGSVWHVLLRPLFDPSPLGYALHYATPALFVVWWLMRIPPTVPQFRTVHQLMLFTFGDGVWLLARGAVTGEYPYGFINVDRVGLVSALRMMGALLIAQWVLALCFTAFARWRLNRLGVCAQSR